MKGSLKLPTAVRWSVGSVLLVLALAGQALAQGSITGTVKFPDDEFREGAMVAITSANYDVFRTNVADDATYAIDDAVPGTYTVAVIAPGLTAAEVKTWS